jgi:predicted N-acetyltransferase YhbS
VAGALHVAVAAVSFFGAGAVVGTAARLWGLGRTRLLLGLAHKEPLDVVVSTTGGAEDHGNAALSDRLKTNLGSMNAMMACAKSVGALHHRKEIRLHQSQDPPASMSQDLVLLGGNNENREAQALIDALRLTCPEVRFHYEDRDEQDNLLVLADGTHPYRWSDKASDRTPADDYGVVVLWANPHSHDHRRRAIFCAGFTARGTEALARDFFGGAGMRRALRTLGRRGALCTVWGMVRRPQRRFCFIASYRIRFGPGAECIEQIAFRRLPDLPPDRILTAARLVTRRDADDELTGAESAQVTTLLTTAFGKDPVGDKDYTQRKPELRFVVPFEGRVVGHVGVVDLSTDFRQSVFGISDLAVERRVWRLGLGRELLACAIGWAKARNADVVMIATEHEHLLPILRGEGFRRVPEHAVYHVDGETGRHRHNPAWHMWVAGGSTIPFPIEIAGDF